MGNLGNKNFKVGELVYCSNATFRSVNSRISGYGVITNIVDKNTKKSYQEKDIITGHGDRNTPVLIYVNLIAKHESDHSDIWDLANKILLLEDTIQGIYDPHSIIKMTYDKMEIDYHRRLDNMNFKLDLFRKYSITRDEKLEIILE